MLNFHQLIALDDQNFSATKNIPHDSTTFPLSAVLKRAYDIWLGSYIVLNGCDCGWQKSHIYCYDSPLCPHHVPKNRTVYIPIHFAHWKKFQLPVPRWHLTCSHNLSCYSNQPKELLNNDWLYFYVSRPWIGNNKKLRCRYVYIYVTGSGKTDLMRIIVESSYNPKNYTLDQLTMDFQIITPWKNTISFAFLLALKRCPYKPALVQAKWFFLSARFAIDYM